MNPFRLPRPSRRPVALLLLLAGLTLPTRVEAADAPVVTNRFTEGLLALEHPLATVETKTVGAVKLACSRPGKWRFALSLEQGRDGCEEVVVQADADESGRVPEFIVACDRPRNDFHHIWGLFDERFACCYSEQESSFAVGLPLCANFDDCQTNVLTLAVADALHNIVATTICDKRNENDHRMAFSFRFFREPELNARRYQTRIRLDARKQFWADAVSSAADWIVAASGSRIAEPPPAAYEPVYSTWYVFRATVNAKELDPELERAAALGMKVVILDDGWQNDRGAWTVDTDKFPDLKAHVAKAHALGLRYMAWFAVPFVEANSAVRDRFKGKYLSDEPSEWALFNLDPRYPEVRRHLAGTLANLMKEFGFDGFKLDFIDEFRIAGKDPAEANGFKGCDCKSLPEAADRLLREISQAIRAIKPDALVEFRQRYIGPVVRQYGQMLRANDCPGDYQANRYRTLALRLTSKGSAVHSDMLLWRPDDTVEEVKRQIWNVMFSVVQYSALLRNIPESHRQALRETIAWLATHRQTLLFGKLTPLHPELGYPCVLAESTSERIACVYASDYVVNLPDDGKPTLLVNATTSNRLIVRQAGTIRQIDLAPSAILPLPTR
ncbi:MAG: glycoside hydrolase family 36 protein [Kiritimatiellia bacterium]|nr:glycoside hydrolase family 36 protein [Kiritimatiellia bacterium]